MVIRGTRGKRFHRPDSARLGDADPLHSIAAAINEQALQYYPPLRRVREYVADNYSNDVSLQRVARIAGIEKKYFSSFFHRKVGICFRHWLAWTRINEATRLMKAEDYAITEVAFASGFKDMRTFERAFTKCRACTPRGYKKRVAPTQQTRVGPTC